jgi:hypothetical protein
VAVIVSFAMSKGIGSVNAPGIGAVRTMEVVAADSVSNASAQEGEVAIITNGEADPMLVAFGSAPDGDAAASSSTTSAGVGIAAGAILVLPVSEGDKIGVAALPA